MKLRLLTVLLTAGLFTACGGETDQQQEKPTQSVEKIAVEEVAVVEEVIIVEEKVAIVEKVVAAEDVVVAEKEVVALVKTPEATVAATSKTAEASGTLHTVKMLNNNADGIMVFEPGFLKINKGDTVYFEAVDAGHDAVSSFAPGDAWKVGFSGGKVTFNDEGVNIYYCSPHKSMAMYGVIQVGEATNKDDAMASAKTSEAGFAMNQGRLMKYMEQVK